MEEIKFTPKEIEEIIEIYGIKFNPLEKISLELSKATRVYEVLDLLSQGSRILMIDSYAGRSIGCFPHIVGDRLKKLAKDVANDAARLLKRFEVFKDGHEIVFEHVLRAGPGYELHEALRELGKSFREVWIRPRYIVPSYRMHDEEERDIKIVYEDFLNFPKSSSVILVKPDTEASGKTAEISLTRAFDEAERKGSNIRTVVLFGFISEPGIKRIEKIVLEHGAKLFALAIGCVTALCKNNYDMPAYGPDESSYSSGKPRDVGCTISEETFHEFLEDYTPGSDMPGDWSARQSRVLLDSGKTFESGGIEKHLKNSIAFIENLRKIYSKENWEFSPKFDKIARRELVALNEELRKYLKAM
ncbi:MAG: hypothetical protein QW265_01290 [Candidatus Bathyarchaeia archaeon]